MQLRPTLEAPVPRVAQAIGLRAGQANRLPHRADLTEEREEGAGAVYS